MSRYTRLHCVIDSHITPTSDAEKQSVSETLLELVRDQLNSKSGYVSVLVPHLRPPARLRNVTLLNATVEQGSRYNRLHVHFVLSIVHTGVFELTACGDGVNIYERLAGWVEQHLPWTTRPYVSVRLLDTRAQNYAAKNSTANEQQRSK